jgi:predicted Zn-dependent protease
LWQDQLLLSNRLERATSLLEVGSLEQAKMLCREILADHPDNERAQKLLTRIDMLGRSQEAMAILKEARHLIEEGQYQDAEAIVSRIDNPELKTEVDEVLKQIETSKQVKQTLKEARALYRDGKLEEALTRAREGLKADFRNEDIKALKKEIETVADLREKANRFLSGPTPFKAHEPLKKIIEMVGEGHPLGQSAAGDLAFLEAESAILAHAAYQNALKKLADDNLKEAMQQLDQLVMDFPQYPYFRTVRDEVNVRVDNLAKSMYRAGYVLESKDPLKAKEIWSRLMGYLPEDHPYAKKIKAKIRF